MHIICDLKPRTQFSYALRLWVVTGVPVTTRHYCALARTGVVRLFMALAAARRRRSNDWEEARRFFDVRERRERRLQESPRFRNGTSLLIREIIQLPDAVHLIVTHGNNYTNNVRVHIRDIFLVYEKEERERRFTIS